MTELAVLVPVRGRPHRVQPLLASIRAATTVPHRTIFICDLGDKAEIAALYKSDAEFFELKDAGYAKKCNAGVKATNAPYVFLGADDLTFEPGWFEAARGLMRKGIGVVGTNDLIPRKREHATHFLMTHDYATQPTIDGQPGPMFEGYHHERTDNELIGTAKHRNAYAYAKNSKVRHLHPMVGAEDDDTYRHGRSKGAEDRRLFHSRRKLWASQS